MGATGPAAAAPELHDFILLWLRCDMMKMPTMTARASTFSGQGRSEKISSKSR